MLSVTNQGYPRSLSYIVKRLNGFQRTGVRLNSLNQSTATNGGLLQVDLPQNTQIDLSTLSMVFQATPTGTGGVSCPRNAEMFLERVETEINGVQIGSSGNYYNHLFSIISDTTIGQDCINRRSVLQNAAIQTVPPTVVEATRQFCIQTWLGFIGSSSTQVINTDLTGGIRLRLTLSNPSVNVLGSAASVSTGFILSNIYFTIDTIQINDGMFQSLQNQFVMQGGVLEVVYKSYQSFTNTVSSMNQSTRFSVSTQSLNRIWATFVNLGSANIIATTAQYGVSTAFTTTAGSGIEPNQGGSSYFQRIGNAQVSYGTSTNYTTVAYPLTNWQFVLNSVSMPQYLVDPGVSYQNMLSSYSLASDTLGGGHPNLKSLNAWLGSFWVAEIRLNAGDSDGSSLVSGMDTRGSNFQGSFNTSGSAITTSSTGTGGTNPGANLTVLIFTEASSSIRIGAGRQIENIL